MTRPLFAGLSILAASVITPHAHGSNPPPSLSPAAPALAGTTSDVRELRAAGPVCLRTLLDRYDLTRDETLIPAIDAVAGQKDAIWSRLYWHTDLEAAKSAAAAERKPILYLRLLGRLTDEYSCANSRFFRTVLYADPAVSALLRERFILVWESERPVPVITIDYGDGRTLRRTITGNNIHYVLSPTGEVVDALPGLLDPDTFISILTAAADAAAGTPALHRAHAAAALERVLAEALRGGSAEVADAPSALPLAAAKQEVESPILAVTSTAESANTEHAPSARDAMPRATGKSLVESPLVRTIVPSGPENGDAPPPAAEAASRAFAKLRVESPLVNAVQPAELVAGSPARDDDPTYAPRHAEQVRLSDQSIALMRRQNPALDADPALLARTLANFRHSIAVDTLINTRTFRRQILHWMIDAPSPIALEDLNRRVYAELFLTPRTDPWLGLLPEATYSALQNDGCGMH